VAGLIVLQTILLIRYLNTSNRKLLHFLEGIKESGSSAGAVGDTVSNNSDELSGFLSEVHKVISNARIQKENQYRYLEYLVEHIGIGIIAFTPDGKVDMINRAAKELFNFDNLTNIRNLNLLREGFDQFLNTLKPGEQRLLKISLRGQVYQLSVRTSVFKIQDKTIKLVSFQDIKTQLDHTEMESWQKLIRVLTHEIMNSITPLSTLTKTLLKQNIKAGDELPDGMAAGSFIEDNMEGLKLIQERSDGLLEFVKQYRHLTRLPVPVFAEVKLNEMLQRIGKLYGNDMEIAGIEFIVSVTPQDLTITADEKMLEQVLINILKNAIEALGKNPSGSIQMTAVKEDDSCSIIIRDNGQGIPEDVMENIFVPFFTTKEEGSGIGLSLSRQILRLHQGSIDIRSAPGKETEVKIRI